MTPARRRGLLVLAWIALAAPALYQLALIIHAIHGRYGYHYDLEWMEGGLLDHAQRIRDGAGIYVPPSIDFIPYLYTPLYPGLLAALGGVVGLTYQLGRAISILSLLGIAGVGYASIVGPARRDSNTDTAPAVAGWLVALGVFAAAYPFVEGWYDLVRADTMFLFMVTAGVHLAARWARVGTGVRGHARIVAIGALMALAFFAKQTAILYVAWVGLIIFVLAWRRAFTYGAVAGVIGLGGAALLQRATGGWFWTYAFRIHQHHDFNMDRFWRSFGYILWHWPALTIVIAATAIVVAVTAITKRGLPPAARPFVLWSTTYGLSTVVGAIGWGTEFAHFNAYMPALLHGGLAVGAALPALTSCARRWQLARPSAPTIAAVLALGVADVTLVMARWHPSKYEPVAADTAAGDKIVAAIAAVPGDVWVPYHPWYAHLAGKRVFVHRMGIRDVTARQPMPVLGLNEAARTHRFAAIVFDNRNPFEDLPDFARDYRPVESFAGGRPRVYTGAPVVPDALWEPIAATTPPAGARVVFDFESGRWTDWELHGAAWGHAPSQHALAGQSQPSHSGGRWYATSMWGGDTATGDAWSPSFTIDGAHLVVHVAGGTDGKLRVELHVGDAVARSATVPGVASEDFRAVTWDVGELAGKSARLVLVDDATASWGHLDVDDVWLTR